MQRELGPSITASGLHITVEQQRKREKKLQKKRERRAGLRRAEKAGEDSLKEQAAEPNGDIFMIDVNPNSVDPEKLRGRDEERIIATPAKSGGRVSNNPPSGVNRAVRRRLKLIEKERVNIQNKLGVAPDSGEQADEVQKRLDEWVVWCDQKTQEREQKMKERKVKVASRQRSRGDRLLEGIKEKERTSGRNKPQSISRR